MLGEDLPRYVDREISHPPAARRRARASPGPCASGRRGGKDRVRGVDGRGVRRVSAQRDAAYRAVAGHVRPDARGDGFGHPRRTARVSRGARGRRGARRRGVTGRVGRVRCWWRRALRQPRSCGPARPCHSTQTGLSRSRSASSRPASLRNTITSWESLWASPSISSRLPRSARSSGGRPRGRTVDDDRGFATGPPCDAPRTLASPAGPLRERSDDGPMTLRDDGPTTARKRPPHRPPGPAGVLTARPARVPPLW